MWGPGHMWRVVMCGGQRAHMEGDVGTCGGWMVRVEGGWCVWCVDSMWGGQRYGRWTRACVEGLDGICAGRRARVLVGGHVWRVHVGTCAGWRARVEGGEHVWGGKGTCGGRRARVEAEGTCGGCTGAREERSRWLPPSLAPQLGVQCSLRYWAP